jgi:predicted nucleic acid-binding Zn ribbon protein
MSTMQTPPPPDAAAPPERRCPRCGSAMAPDQEWCLACGAAATTEVAEPRGWRVPIVLTGAIAVLFVIGVVLTILALSGGSEKLAQSPTPTPSAAAPPPTTTPVPSATATVSPLPSETPGATTTPDPNATTTPDPNATTTPDPNASPTPTPDNSGTDSGSTFTEWPGGSGYTVIIESASTQSKAESVATEAQGQGHTVGILHSDDYSSLNPGYYVVFTEKYSSESEAQTGLDAIKSDYPDAYVRRVAP